jgi:hypothetical protein
VNSSRDKCRFSDFCLFLRDESQDSLRASRTQPIFVDFCPYQRDESVNSSRDKCRFPDFCPFLRDECHFSDYCQASIHPSSFVSAFRLPPFNCVCDPGVGRGNMQ